MWKKLSCLTDQSDFTKKRVNARIRSLIDDDLASLTGPIRMLAHHSLFLHGNDGFRFGRSVSKSRMPLVNLLVQGGESVSSGNPGASSRAFDIFSQKLSFCAGARDCRNPRNSSVNAVPYNYWAIVNRLTPVSFRGAVCRVARWN